MGALLEGGDFLDIIQVCEKIWAGYKTYARGASVIRIGFEYVGETYPVDDNLDLQSTFIRRSESILEHQAKTAHLALAFYSNFPTFFGPEAAKSSALCWEIFALALGHDVGETANGDVADDGSPLHDSASRINTELEVFTEFAKTYEPHDQRSLIEAYKAFSHHDFQDFYHVMAIYALDKIEAAATQLVLESCGIYGRISAKPYPTEQDLHYTELTGSDLAADNWGRGTIDRLQDLPSEITSTVFTFLDVAALDVRGESFSWLPDELYYFQ